MTTQTERSSLFMEQLDVLTGPLAQEKSPDWLARLRREGLARFRQLGIPTLKDEEWKYTNVSPLAGYRYAPVAKSALSPAQRKDILERHASKEDLNIVFVNGALDKELSGLGKVAGGVEILPLRDAVENNPAPLQEIWAQYDPQKDSAFVALNKALTREGICIHVEDKTITDQVIHVLHLTQAIAEQMAVFPHTFIRLGKSSEATVLETHIGLNDESVYFADPVTDIVIEENATLHYSKAQKESLRAFHVGTTRVRQKRDST
ncbi:MAG: SufD family Fe-S cluster assembly protein, partial [Candidatus Omnitrophica bacterium]|nr:SufD family Fe-S cluster assembly protein [Candidatus Omnitrophota bacterium]